jgi:CubicO group peptidase (beta-lactamase class C family)
MSLRSTWLVSRPVNALAQIDAWPVDHAAAGVVRASETWWHGPADRRFPWASVTKLLTALATLVAAEEGVLDLDEQAGPPGSTVRHLLAHASGLPFDGPRPISQPGKRRIYSNTGFDQLGAFLEQKAEMSFADYLRAALLEPLGLSGTALEGRPSSGLVGPLDDLLAFGRELQAPTLVAPETLDEATAVAFPGLSGILPDFGRYEPLDWGLGFELRDAKEPHWTGTHNSPETFGHFGGSGSFIWVDPAAGLACAALADQRFGQWAKDAWPPLSDAVLAELHQTSSS